MEEENKIIKIWKRNIKNDEIKNFLEEIYNKKKNIIKKIIKILLTMLMIIFLNLKEFKYIL